MAEELVLAFVQQAVAISVDSLFDMFVCRFNVKDMEGSWAEGILKEGFNNVVSVAC